MKSRLLRRALGTSAALLATALAPIAQPVLAAAPEQQAQHESGGEKLDDAAITARVKAALLEAKDVHSMDIHVTTNDGVVQLSGFADSPYEASRATEVARKVPGVKQVDNTMKAKSHP